MTLATPLARFATSRLPPYRPGVRNESTGLPESRRSFTSKKKRRSSGDVCYERVGDMPAVEPIYVVSYVPPLCSPSLP
jgi:hypothetical protein